MSRSWKVLFAALLLPATPAMAQQAGEKAGTGAEAGAVAGVDADRAIAQRMMSGPLTPDKSRSRCLRTVRQGEITVCAPDEDQFRVPSTSETDPNSDQALNDGRLHPPDVAGGGIFRGKATMGGKCFLPPCPPEAAYLIDLSTIPVAPAGSDADKIAKGELRAP